MAGIRLHPRRRARAIASRGRRARGAREGGVGPALDERAYDSGGPRRARGLGPRRLTNYKRVSGDAVEYEAFARTTRRDPLHQVGSVVPPHDHPPTPSPPPTSHDHRLLDIAISP